MLAGEKCFSRDVDWTAQGTLPKLSIGALRRMIAIASRFNPSDRSPANAPYWTDRTKMVAAANLALEQSKKQGRDRTSVYQSELSS